MRRSRCLEAAPDGVRDGPFHVAVAGAASASLGAHGRMTSASAAPTPCSITIFPATFRIRVDMLGCAGPVRIRAAGASAVTLRRPADLSAMRRRRKFRPQQ
jgi:hypothetical protein